MIERLLTNAQSLRRGGALSATNAPWSLLDPGVPPGAERHGGTLGKQQTAHPTL